MAKIVNKSRKRGGVKTRVITKYKRVTVAAKRGAKRVRRAAGVSVSKKAIAVTVAAGGAGAIGSALVISKMPESVPDIAKNGIMVAIGAAVAYRGFKRRNNALIGAASVGVTGVISAAKESAAASTAASTVSMPLAIPCDTTPLNAPVYDVEMAGLEKVRI
ncbi:MAG: hypothetical protein II671_02795 [Salinivirgaceae bacterium]|nr:hypothetical protein [Salinivirgaceae bacterium]